jgi:hypothetical protein
MSPNDLDAEIKKVPFQPFRIVTSLGKAYEITERDLPIATLSPKISGRCLTWSTT